jgi:hypothetical protein
VLQAVQEWAREVGAAPYCYEWDPASARNHGREHADGVQKWIREYPRWPSARTATALWGSWRAFLTEAGLPSPPPLRMALRERLDTAQRMRGHRADVVADIIGVHPNTVKSYWRAGRCPSCGGLKVHQDARVCALCVSRTPRRSLSRETVIAAIQTWTQETGAPPLADEWMLGQGKWDAEYPRWPALSQVQEAFGSWNAAMSAAGFGERLQRWTRDAVIDAARRWADVHGRAPNSQDWARSALDGSHPERNIPTRVFGSWNAMLAAAGLPITHRLWSRADILDALSAWTDTHQRAPTTADWGHGPHHSFPSPGTVHNHFGSWTAMLIAGGATPSRQR